MTVAPVLILYCITLIVSLRRYCFHFASNVVRYRCRSTQELPTFVSPSTQVTQSRFYSPLFV
ncbi:uncharacterized protein LY89DRAFT_412846 [Mollisia scopiformis]|uniref:Uncharacterized protein n=1 Tax=Mollisia scopiformis TaxID=149040 RepID=A0A132B1R2_MOLSC|nr:uncharacterized protein LY89DRAFT_412846 [Mollisia scopiformis]KUJ06316.1 hypothetical protein LY89DRAFT_412846 [Mollisia scopiformis]